MKYNTNSFYRDIKLVQTAKKIYRTTKIISVFSVLLTAGFVGFDIFRIIKNRA